MMQKWHTLLSRLWARITMLTPRERAIIALMVAVGGIAIAFKAEDDMSAAQRLSNDAVLVNAAASGLAREERIAFSTALDAAAREARRASIGGETIHIARARAQSVVASLAQQAGLEGVTTTMKSRDARKKEGGPVEAIEVNLTGIYDKAALARFLQLLSRSEYSLSPVSVSVRSGDVQRIEMRIAAYALVDGEET